MKYVFLAIFVVSSIIHLWASYVKNKKVRAYSKPFIILALAFWYVCTTGKISAVVILALFFSWLGDVLLIPEGVKWFTAGGISFLISHLFFIMCYAPQVDFAKVGILPAVLIALVYITAATFIFKGLKPHLPKALFYPMYLYLLINGTMNCFACYQLISIPCLATAITFIGAMLFFASDSILFYVRFSKETRWKSHFPVMITYILSEFFIVLGIILLKG